MLKGIFLKGYTIKVLNIVISDIWMKFVMFLGRDLYYLLECTPDGIWYLGKIILVDDKTKQIKK